MKKALKLVSFLAVITVILAMFVGCSQEGGSHEGGSQDGDSQRNELVSGRFIIVREGMSNEEKELLYEYPTRIIFNGDGTGYYPINSGRADVIISYTVDDNGYVTVYNNQIKDGNTMTPVVQINGKDSYPKMSGYLQGNVYILEHVNLKYEKDS